MTTQTSRTALAGKKALVLGGSRGIGAAIAERLAGDGADTILTYLGSADAAAALAERIGAKAHKVDSADRTALAGFIVEEGPFDIVVINAGVASLGDPLELDPGEVDRMIDVNVRGPYHAAVEAARAMPNGGRIIITGSVNGDRVPFPGGAAYSMTKSAVQGMVRGLARDFGDRAITVNAIQPGPVDTDMNPADGPMKEMMHSFLAIKRHARPQEIAGLVAYLAGPEAGFVTGSLHTIDGGMGA